MKLYDYYRSSCSYRVRIALNLKNISYECIPIHLVNHGGEQHTASYRALNPEGVVPTLYENGHVLTQSIAIIEYLNDLNPTPPLLPQNPLERAHVKSLALMIACDMHPLNNLRVLKQLQAEFQATDDAIQAWYHHWLRLGFDAFETTLEKLARTASVCSGHHVSLADICLIPQVYNAKRFQFDMTPYPLIEKINAYCLTLEAFKKASPTMVE